MNDLISRQDAIDALGERPFIWTGGDYELGCVNQYDLDKLAIENAPTIEPMRKRGKWIRHSIGHENTPWGFDCSACGKWFVISEDSAEKYNYCPNCGAEMKGENDGDGLYA